MRKYLYEISRKKLTVGSAAIILSFTSLASNILGLYRERIIASMFGTNYFAEIYGASFRLPDLIFNILILGALSAAFIPIFIERLVEDEDKESAWRLANSFLNLLLIVAVVGAILIAILAPYIVPLLVPGFKHKQVGVDMMQITVNTTRLLLLSPIFMCISGVFSGILNSFKRFVAYSIAPLIYNLSIIIAAIFLAEGHQVPVYGLAVGVIIGAFFHAAIQIPAVIDAGFKYRFILDLKDNGLRKIVRLMGPRTFTIGVTQINLLVDTIKASYLVGGIAILNYANNIQTLPTVVFGIAIATAAFPYLSEALSSKRQEDFRKAFSWSFKRILYFMIPASVGIIVLRAQIVRLIFGIGNFDWSSTEPTAYVLGIFGFGLVAQGLLPLLTRTFYVLQDTKTPLKIAIIGMVINALGTIFLPGLSLTLPQIIYNPSIGFYVLWYQFTLGVGGIALAFIAAGFVTMFMSYIVLHKRLGNLHDADIIKDFVKILLASIIMGIVAHYALYLFDPLVQNSGGKIAKGLLPQTILSIILAVISYFSLTLVMKIGESREILRKIQKVLAKS
ncbi:TPA: murein biosynthesis integral membrane protein MurJ [candidate division CPR2 bacterium]|uniref:Probable lipid II flippase MurJ n=1 Tax=candidate division CPR2 bacterium GW2011_GWC1_41_48 TaxID=1618344 RepID=A0A0G0Z8D0_UNCC2|nr:MAG: putative peptidoglycan lipid II flippase MurJ [candidate division CPR2 bacterium GW2011_GWC2_39_35]KKR27482.1 MAG: putative peptidoglycan lipid II flippase MurJ [candidate division CPR2 bacterium GW2011_GWD1_39_7]KKR29097.1 MAG: putative peptidoglycan lipid II flippase MurJ [candidate division CPR2 bacterium GW2011_GWD2_39_7]KKS09288.1 MAG: putative peptidoglycan lipid II flippase MurJ [candidate division CPR2 bacterium GW2011_GWC1_41_48]OGB58901.1 MAG: murein biosynthesis integral memb